MIAVHLREVEYHSGFLIRQLQMYGVGKENGMEQYNGPVGVIDGWQLVCTDRIPLHVRYDVHRWH
jgi:hypothetical protein